MAALPMFPQCPSGRASLLQWVNFMTCAAYDTIEQLGDGVLYCQLLEMCTPHCPPFLHKLSSFDCIIGDQVAGENSVNADRRERNLHLFQAQCRQLIEKRLAIEVNVPRLAQGKLQDHVVVCKWIHSLFARLAKAGKPFRFVLAAESRRAEAAAAGVAVDGLLNPTLIRRQAPQLRPAPDAMVRARRMQYASALAKLEEGVGGEPVGGHAPAKTSPSPQLSAGGTLGGRRRQQDVDPGGHHTTTAAADPQLDEILARLQNALLAKSRRLATLETHLAQFSDMYEASLNLSAHIRGRAGEALHSDRSTADDRRVAAQVVLSLAGNDTADDVDLRRAMDILSTDPRAAMAARSQRTACSALTVLGEATRRW